jgi:hypothetical protein
VSLKQLGGRGKFSVFTKFGSAVVFSLIAIEAFINEFAIKQFSKKFLKNHLDNLSLISKLILIPKLANKKCLDTDGQLYEDIKWLIDLRNSLVHFHTISISVDDIDYSDPISQRDFMLEQHSERAVKTKNQHTGSGGHHAANGPY